jgi:hypothetical protein
VVPLVLNIFDNSYSIQSEIEADISAITSYDLDIKLPYWQAVTSVKKVILILGAQLAKSIHTNDKSLEITPTIAAHAGSQYFYQEYYKFNRVGNRKDNGNGQDQQIGSTVVEMK